MGHKVDVEDYINVQNMLGEYQWLVDEGDQEGWADLWTEDGAFVGGLAEPVVGREQLKEIPKWVIPTWHGNMRHTCGSMFMRYGSSRDEMIVKLYNLVTDWNNTPSLFTLSLSELTIVRQGDDWKIKRNDIRNLAPSRTLGEEA